MLCIYKLNTPTIKYALHPDGLPNYSNTFAHVQNHQVVIDNKETYRPVETISYKLRQVSQVLHVDINDVFSLTIDVIQKYDVLLGLLLQQLLLP